MKEKTFVFLNLFIILNYIANLKSRNFTFPFVEQIQKKNTVEYTQLTEWNFHWIPFFWNHKYHFEFISLSHLLRCNPSLVNKFKLHSQELSILGLRYTILSGQYKLQGKLNFGNFPNFEFYFLAVHTISLTQLHLPPTGSKAKYDGHW